VRMHRDGSVGKLHEDNFGWLYKWEAPHHQYESTRRAGRLHRAGQKEHTDGIRRTEPELEPVCLVLVERIGVEHLDIQEPFLEIVGRNQLDPRRQRIADLGTHPLAPRASGPRQDVANLLELFTQPLCSKLRPHVERWCCCLFRKRRAANVSKWRDERVTRRGRETSSSLVRAVANLAQRQLGAKW
jgi:hypothetical protein